MPTNKQQIKNLTDNFGIIFPFGKAEARLIKFAEKEIPKSCLVVANLPIMLATTDLDTQRLDYFYQDPKKYFINSDCLLFFKDFSCYERYPIPEHREFQLNCAKTGSYQLLPVKSYFVFGEDKKYELGFYKILNK